MTSGIRSALDIRDDQTVVQDRELKYVFQRQSEMGVSFFRSMLGPLHRGSVVLG
jgi:hypothetical protein